MHKYLFDNFYYYRYLFFLFKNGLKKIITVDDWKIMPKTEFKLNIKSTNIYKKDDIDLIKKLSNNKSEINYQKIFEDTQTSALLIYKNNRIIYEKYDYGNNEKSPQRNLSISKIIITSLIGKLIDEKKIHNINDEIGKYLPELNSYLRKKTIKQLLVMDGGINYTEGKYPWKYYIKFSFSTNMNKLLNEAKKNNKEGRYFTYNNFYPCILVLLIKKLTNNNLIEYLKNEILAPLGCSGDFSISIDSCKNKFEKLDIGFNCSPRNILKIGIMYLNNGFFNKKQILSKKWIIESTCFKDAKNNKKDPLDYLGANIRSLFFSKSNTYFKYFWWGYKKNKSYDFFSIGRLGQIMYINKTKKIIFIRLGKKWTRKIPISEIALKITESI